MTDEEKRVRPHIISRSDEHAPLAGSDLERDEYAYFAYSGSEQMDALKEKIKKKS